MDARQYHLCLDTGALGMEKAEAIILEAVQARFGNIEIKSRKQLKAKSDYFQRSCVSAVINGNSWCIQIT